MYGVEDQIYFMSGGKAYRYCKAAPIAERGCIDGVPVTQTISTATVGEMDEHKRKNWHRFGMTFEVIGSATVNTVTVKAGGALAASVPTSYVQTLNRAYTTGYNDFVVPAGIGSHVLASATVTLTGNVRLQEAAFWFTGAEPKR
jgi:hypothetical protein